MGKQLHFSKQIIIAIFLSIFFGYLLSETSNIFLSNLDFYKNNPIVDQSDENDILVIKENVWKFNVLFPKNDIPILEKAEILPTGKVTFEPKGENRIQIIDTQGNLLYEHYFLLIYEHNHTNINRNQIYKIFVLPAFENQKYVRIITDTNEAVYDISK